MSEIRPATKADLPALSALAMRSKAHWGYSTAFMDACRDELSVTSDHIAEGEVHGIWDGGVWVGFYSLEWLDDARAELGHLFVEPSHIGRGYGRRLIDHSRERCRANGRSRLIIQGDPNAERFYLATGATRQGERPSDSIPGRVLPLFVLDLR